ncbi:Flp family type IVb pilin [Ensifer soli]|uniref:Flp family type IVb pilin n=1 Tax=Ciceribacter sp. sgz301302 TaxID=3342379 RepID=UPI0035B72095
MSILRRLIRDRSAATAVEYGLLTALISIAMISGMTAFSTEIQAAFDAIREAIVTARD